MTASTTQTRKGRQSSSGAMNPLPSLIRASAWDAGNQSMRAAGRTIWAAEDRDAASDCQERLIRACFGRADDTDPREAYCRFGFAEAMEKARALSLTTKNFHAVLDAAYAQYVASFDQVAA